MVKTVISSKHSSYDNGTVQEETKLPMWLFWYF